MLRILLTLAAAASAVLAERAVPVNPAERKALEARADILDYCGLSSSGYDLYCINMECCFQGGSYWSCIDPTLATCCTTGLFCPNPLTCYLEGGTQYCIDADKKTVSASSAPAAKTTAAGALTTTAPAKATETTSSPTDSKQTAPAPIPGKNGGPGAAEVPGGWLVGAAALPLVFL